MTQVLVGVDGKAKKAGVIYVGINKVAHKLKRAYVGIDGKAHLFYTGDPILIFESKESGSYTLNLTAGKFEFTLIGAGGGASGRRSSVSGTHYYAQGGVGGTLQFVAILTEPASVSITVGSGGATNTGTFSSASGGTVTGVKGGDTTIAGIPNLTAKAGGGTAGSTTATSTTGCNRNVGVIGTNTLTGTAVQNILINNNNQCVSSQGSSSANSRAATNGRTNDNWPEDNTRGKAGDCGRNGTSFIKATGFAGYIRVRQL